MRYSLLNIVTACFSVVDDGEIYSLLSHFFFIARVSGLFMGHLHLCATFQEASLFDFPVHCLGKAVDTFNMISKKSYQSRTQRERIKELISKGLRNE